MPGAPSSFLFLVECVKVVFIFGHTFLSSFLNPYCMNAFIRVASNSKQSNQDTEKNKKLKAK